MKRKININLTYECNSNCRFCAANHEIAGNIGRITYDELQSICNKWDFNMNDEIILSGGEPTIHPEFWDIIEMLQKRKCKICILTNGRQLINNDFSNRLSHSHISRICVPIHGPEEIHDSITRVKGSFRQTITGLEAFNRIKGNIHLELKFVICNKNYLSISEIIEQIICVNPNSIMMSTLFQTEVALKNEEIVDATVLLQATNKAVKLLQNSSFKGDIAIYGVPLCLYEDEVIIRLLGNENSEYYLEDEYKELYFDYTQKEGVVLNHSANVCEVKKCALHSVCTSGDEKNFSMFRSEIRPFIVR